MGKHIHVLDGIVADEGKAPRDVELTVVDEVPDSVIVGVAYMEATVRLSELHRAVTNLLSQVSNPDGSLRGRQ